MTAQRRLYAVLKNAGLLIYAIFALFPLFWMLLLTFKSDAQMLTTTFFFTPTLVNYEEVFLKSDYFRYIRGLDHRIGRHDDDIGTGWRRSGGLRLRAGFKEGTDRLSNSVLQVHSGSFW